MDEQIELRPAEPSDLESVAALLRENRLPSEGLRDALKHAAVASISGRVVGFVALELYGGVALLRSLAVTASVRGRGLGVDLTREALKMARALGARDVYLLTETADGFFPRFGFVVEDRGAAPEALKASVEFRSACPAGARMMHARVPA